MNSFEWQGLQARGADVAWLAQALQAARADTLQTFACYLAGLPATSTQPALQVPRVPEFNPPLWELGHIGWFQTLWLARNPQWRLGVRADPQVARLPSQLAGLGALGALGAFGSFNSFDSCDPADALYDSSCVPHASRWQLPLPAPEQAQAELSAQLTQTLALLAQAEAGAAQQYFFRLALLHEDMHHEAALYMAQSLGLAIADARWQPQRLTRARDAVELAATDWRLGQDAGDGFAFDNELGRCELKLPASAIDVRVVSWAEYLPFVEAGGYAQPQWWSAAGRAWLQEEAQPLRQAPRYLRKPLGADGWQVQRWGQWQHLDTALAACHLSAFEAEAWCAWSGRRLPSEVEWERAAQTLGPAFHWGQVWEWTSSDFLPFDGFEPHPYRDYSAPWFGQRRVLRGASFMTQPRMRHLHYRNFFAANRTDLAGGFRSCSREPSPT
jgi:ergothioneine biosynthesis protein EgtB